MKIGDKVIHKKTRLVRRIVRTVRGVKGGVIIDKPVEGFKYWNKADLKPYAKEATR